MAELISSRYRAVVTVCTLFFPRTLGTMLQPAIAYVIRDEFWYQLVTLTPNIIFPPLIMYVYAIFINQLHGITYTVGLFNACNIVLVFCVYPMYLIYADYVFCTQSTHIISVHNIFYDVFGFLSLTNYVQFIL